MKYAIVGGEKLEAAKGLQDALCQGCGQQVTSKCGPIKVHHWAHKGKKLCDQWWEPETEWHRTWKNIFPREWQEVIQYADEGEKHIADVKTPQDSIFEFQNSFLTAGERNSRNSFYKKLIWVVNGLRRKTDVIQFNKVLEEGTWVGKNNLIREVKSDDCRLIREWYDSSSPVFFDFGEPNRLWLLFPNCSGETAYVAPFGRNELLVPYLENDITKIEDFEKFMKESVPSFKTWKDHQSRIANQRYHLPPRRRHFRL